MATLNAVGVPGVETDNIKELMKYAIEHEYHDLAREICKIAAELELYKPRYLLVDRKVWEELQRSLAWEEGRKAL